MPSVNSRRTGQVILLRIREICYDRERMVSRRAMVERNAFAVRVNLPISSLEIGIWVTRTGNNKT